MIAGTRLYKLIAVLVMIPSLCLGWGRDGHETINASAARILPPSPIRSLLVNNIEAVKRISMTPDLSWKHGNDPDPLEAHTHFLNIEFYAKPVPRDFKQLYNKYGKEKILEEGSVPYRIKQLSILLYQLMAKPHPSPIQIVQIASALGHYVGDAGNPLHVNTDYDGKIKGVPGTHSFFESVTVRETDPQELTTQITNRAMRKLQNIPDEVPPIEGAFWLIDLAHEHSARVIGLAKDLGFTARCQDRYRPIIYDTASNSTAMLAKIWYAAWTLAGRPNLDTDKLKYVPTPEWVPLEYMPGR